jgi:hydrogenase/urease accessory protein HupE
MSGTRASLLLVLIIGLWPAPRGDCHGVALIPVFTLQEIQSGQFIGTWLIEPATTDPDQFLSFPPQCSYTSPHLNCGSKGLGGQIALNNPGVLESLLIVKVDWQKSASRSYTLSASQPHVVIFKGASGWLQACKTYIPLGISHILLGVDHLLFVLGLIWIVGCPWMLLKTITAFTLAHMLSLTGATLGWVGVQEQPVNAAIALSIVFIGVEIIKKQRGEGGLASTYPWLVALFFGLLHGFGFSGALANLGLPRADIPLALLFFNLGVEAGQIGFVLLVLALQWSHRTLDVHQPRWSEPLPAYAIGSIAMFWFITRFAAMF